MNIYLMTDYFVRAITFEMMSGDWHRSIKNRMLNHTLNHTQSLIK